MLRPYRPRLSARAVLRGRITLRPYTVDPHNIYCVPLYGRNVMRPQLGTTPRLLDPPLLACRPHGSRALSAGRIAIGVRLRFP